MAPPSPKASRCQTGRECLGGGIARRARDAIHPGSGISCQRRSGSCQKHFGSDSITQLTSSEHIGKTILMPNASASGPWRRAVLSMTRTLFLKLSPKNIVTHSKICVNTRPVINTALLQHWNHRLVFVAMATLCKSLPPSGKCCSVLLIQASPQETATP